jgi:hypothetical protein
VSGCFLCNSRNQNRISGFGKTLDNALDLFRRFALAENGFRYATSKVTVSVQVCIFHSRGREINQVRQGLVGGKFSRGDTIKNIEELITVHGDFSPEKKVQCPE